MISICTVTRSRFDFQLNFSWARVLKALYDIYSSSNIDPEYSFDTILSCSDPVFVF